MKWALAWIEGRSRVEVLSLAAGLILALGVIDIASGYEISFAIFYLVPVALVVWTQGRRLGLAAALASAATWLVADIAAREELLHPTVHAWNALVRLGFFVVVVLALAALSDAVERLRATAEGLRASLQQVRVLSGLIPMCAWCRSVRDDRGYWQDVETYVEQHTDAAFTHGICQECRDREMGTSRSAT